MIDKLTKCKFYRFNTFSVIPDEYFAGNLEKIMNNTLRPIRHTWRGRYFVVYVCSGTPSFFFLNLFSQDWLFSKTKWSQANYARRFLTDFEKCPFELSLMREPQQLDKEQKIYESILNKSTGEVLEHKHGFLFVSNIKLPNQRVIRSHATMSFSPISYKL
uniref:Uncharacterized protein n=1 Tax=Ditylenchus dipsaci TaxID=166011 RepID=A0A915EKL7_9BILA